MSEPYVRVMRATCDKCGIVARAWKGHAFPVVVPVSALMDAARGHPVTAIETGALVGYCDGHITAECA